MVGGVSTVLPGDGRERGLRRSSHRPCARGSPPRRPVGRRRVSTAVRGAPRHRTCTTRGSGRRGARRRCRRVLELRRRKSTGGYRIGAVTRGGREVLRPGRSRVGRAAAAGHRRRPRSRPSFAIAVTEVGQRHADEHGEHDEPGQEARPAATTTRKRLEELHLSSRHPHSSGRRGGLHGSRRPLRERLGERRFADRIKPLEVGRHDLARLAIPQWPLRGGLLGRLRVRATRWRVLCFTMGRLDVARLVTGRLDASRVRPLACHVLHRTHSLSQRFGRCSRLVAVDSSLTRGRASAAFSAGPGGLGHPRHLSPMNM